MGKVPTVLDAYNHWWSEVLFRAKGIHPRRSTSEDAIKPEYKVFFEKFVKLVDDTDGIVDWKLYIEDMAKFHSGWFHPKSLTTPKGMKVYRTMIKTSRLSSDPDEIYAQVAASVSFVRRYCIENGIHSLDDYLDENRTFIPTMLKHYSAGSISPFFLAMIHDIASIIKGYPKDASDEFMSGFIEEKRRFRDDVIRVKRLSGLINNFRRGMDIIINKGMETPMP